MGNYLHVSENRFLLPLLPLPLPLPYHYFYPFPFLTHPQSHSLCNQTSAAITAAATTTTTTMSELKKEKYFKNNLCHLI
jgi:hypothetical protein